MLPGVLKQVVRGLLVCCLAGFSFGAISAENAKSGRTPKPVIEAATQGDKCVEDTDYMRKNHMKLLLHQRDQTVHNGVRTQRHSIKNCIACHASKTNNSVAASKENFCQSCHNYTAVKMDCFECHATKPKSATAALAIQPAQPVAVRSSVGAGKK